MQWVDEKESCFARGGGSGQVGLEDELELLDKDKEGKIVWCKKSKRKWVRSSPKSLYEWTWEKKKGKKKRGGSITWLKGFKVDRERTKYLAGDLAEIDSPV